MTPSRPAPPELPHVWRPARTRTVTLVMSAVVLVCMTVLASLLPAEGPRSFAVSDRVGVLLVGWAIVGILLLLGRPRLVAEESGLTVVNMVGRRRLVWEQVVRVNFRPGDPWAFFDLDDGTTLAVLGIQSSDGERAVRAVRQLRALVEQRTRTERDD